MLKGVAAPVLLYEIHGLMAEPFRWFFRATNEVQPSHEWERHHLRPAHPAVSCKDPGAGDQVLAYSARAPLYSEG